MHMDTDSCEKQFTMIEQFCLYAHIMNYKCLVVKVGSRTNVLKAVNPQFIEGNSLSLFPKPSFSFLNESPKYQIEILYQQFLETKDLDSGDKKLKSGHDNIFMLTSPRCKIKWTQRKSRHASNFTVQLRQCT